MNRWRFVDASSTNSPRRLFQAEPQRRDAEKRKEADDIGNRGHEST
jgi:hypothetical protein